MIRDGVPVQVRHALREALLRAHERSAAELRAFGFVRFVDADDAVY